MKATFIFLLLLIYPIVMDAQVGFQPILDSAVACSYGKPATKIDMPNPLYENKDEGGLELFYIVEEMPEPKTSVNEIESMLGSTIRLHAQEMNYQGNIFLQCIVNCRGTAGDYQIMYCPAELVNTGCQLLRIFREEINNWEPGKQRGKNVDTLIKIQIKLKKGNFSVKAPLY